jgi:hypothetical protein
MLLYCRDALFLSLNYSIFAFHFLRAYNQQGQPGALKYALGDTPHSPTLQPSAPMR